MFNLASNIMKISMIILVLFLSACANKAPSTIEYDSKGNIVRTTTIVSGKQYLELQASRAAEQSNIAYHNAQAVKYQQLKDGRDIALVEAISALAGNRNPTNYNDVLTQRSKASSQKWGTVVGGVTKLVGFGLPFLFDSDRNKSTGAGNVTVSDGGKANIITVADNSSFNGALDGGRNGNNSFNEDNDTTTTSTTESTGSSTGAEGEEASDGLFGLQPDGTFAGSGTRFCTVAQAAANGNDCPR